MGKDIGRIYKHSQSQLSTSSIKAPVSSSSEPQNFSAVKLKTNYVPSITDKHQTILFCVTKTPPIMMQPSQTMTTYSLVIHKIINITTISTSNHHSKRISSTSSITLTSNTPTILPPVGKEYMCFLKEGKSDQASRCTKWRIMTKVIDYFFSIDTFEQQCVVLKGMLQSTRLKDNVQTIGIHPSLINNAIYEHKCLENIKGCTQNMVSVTINNNSKTFLRLLWFILLNDSPTTVLYLPWSQHQSRNQVLENHCVCLLTY